MRFPSILPCIILVSALAGCTSIPGLDNIPLWQGDPVKLQRLGKGAPVADVDKALGHSRILATESIDIDGVPYQFRLYDWVEKHVVTNTVCSQACVTNTRPVKVPYVIVYAGSEPRLYSWGTLKELGKSDNPAMVRMSSTLLLRYYQIK